MRERGKSFAGSALAANPKTLPAPAAMNSRRVYCISSSHSKTFEFLVPGGPVRPNEQFVGFHVVNHLFALGVPAETSAEFQRQVGQVTDRCHPMAAFEVGDRCFA